MISNSPTRQNLLSRSPGENGVACDGPELRIISQDGTNDVQDRRVLDHLLEDEALVQEVPNAGLKVGFGVFAALKKNRRDRGLQASLEPIRKRYGGKGLWK